MHVELIQVNIGDNNILELCYTVIFVLTEMFCGKNFTF
jgi:hypothetical protein